MSRRVGFLSALIVAVVAVWLLRGGGGEPAQVQREGNRPAASGGRQRELPPSRDPAAAAPEGASAPRFRARAPSAKDLDPVAPMRPRGGSAGGAADPGPDDFEKLIQTATQDPDPTERAAAIADLSLLDDVDAVVPVIRQAASDPDPDVKLAVVEALSQLGEAVPMDLLTEFANDPDPEIRLEVLNVIESLSEEESTARKVAPLLQSAARDPNEDVRDRAQDIIESLSESSD